MKELDFALPGTEASDLSDIPTCDFCGHPGATRRARRNPEEFYCYDIWACIGRKWPEKEEEK